MEYLVIASPCEGYIYLPVMLRFMLCLLALFIVAVMTSPIPGHTKHVKHRIHVPTKIHTVFVTKYIKVPEHHHHHHVIKKEQHHHHHKVPHGKLPKFHDESLFDDDHFDHDSGL